MARLTVLFAVSLLASTAAYADCGSIPYYSPLRMSPLSEGAGFLFNTLPDGKKRVEFDPSDVVVYEPGQRGILLWNGVEEILLLSTEISTNSAVSILEVIPMPSEPTVTLGSFETFERMQALLIKKQMWTVASGGGVANVQLPAHVASITFHQRMGAHDVAVVQVHDTTAFSDWVMAYLRSQEAINPEIDPRFLQIIQNYLNRGFRWFVFDTIDTSDKVQSREPIQYRFKTEQLFYPLEISTLETGNTAVELLLVTPEPIKQRPELMPAPRYEEPVAITAHELADVLPEWDGFFAGAAMTMQPVRMKGTLQSMDKDFVAR